jgi:hypothetical protein
MLYRKFIGIVAATAIAVTALGASPAFADDRDNARLLAALLGLAVVGKIIHDNQKDRKRSRYEAPHRPQPDRTQRRYYPDQVARPRARPAPQWGYHDPIQPRPLPRRVDRKLLPGECFRSFDTYEGRVRMFGRKCLEKNYRFAHRLPQQCMTAVRTDRGKRRGFEARCLRREGYRLAHR